jgi:hydrogenase maturation protease
LRSDDGLAWHAAEILRRELPPEAAEIRCVHQLAPELAESASRSQLVIFIDAALGGEPGHLTCEPINKSPSAPSSSHGFTPAAILSLAHELYGAAPQAISVSLHGECFDHGDRLSPAVARALPKLASTVVGLLSETWLR